jgi:hypothetical protein
MLLKSAPIRVFPGAAVIRLHVVAKTRNFEVEGLGPATARKA